jgi:hypothetical protein
MDKQKDWVIKLIQICLAIILKVYVLAMLACIVISFYNNTIPVMFGFPKTTFLTLFQFFIFIGFTVDGFIIFFKIGRHDDEDLF